MQSRRWGNSPTVSRRAFLGHNSRHVGLLGEDPEGQEHLEIHEACSRADFRFAVSPGSPVPTPAAAAGAAFASPIGPIM